MQLDGMIQREGVRKLISPLPAYWQGPLARLALVWAGIFALTFREWQAMVSQWWNISTYNHILFVPLIAGWLIYSRRSDLAGITPQAWFPGLLMLGAALFVWLIGSLAGVNTVSQLGAVLALQTSIAAVLGLRVTAAALFPLLYLVFLVPFGDELVPALQMITAEMVIALTQLSGVPAVIDGVFIDTPVGLFEVAEACSGVKFLIAMIALGTLICYCCFSTWKRRIIFMVSAIALSIAANSIRAWGTIFIAQSQGIEFAEGFDHIFYGWVFFALIVGGLLVISWRWFDRDPDDLGIDLPGAPQSGWFRLLSVGTMAGNRAAVFAGVLLAIFAFWHTAASRVEAAVPGQISLPEQVADWNLVDYSPAVAWQPRASGADHRLLGRYRNDAGQEVDIFLALYSAQEDGRDASAFGEGALDPGSDWRWLAPGTARTDAFADYLFVYGKHKRLAETSYRTGNLLTGSAAKLKLANMIDRLTLRARPTMMLILSAEERQNREAARSISDFRRSVGDQGEWMDRIAQLR